MSTPATTEDVLRDLGRIGHLAKTLTDEDSIESYKRRSPSIWVFSRADALLSVIIALIALGVGVAYMVQSANLVAVVCTIGVTLFASVGFARDNGAYLDGKLQTLAVSGECSDALNLVRTSATAAKWRDAAVAAGRELRKSIWQSCRSCAKKRTKLNILGSKLKSVKSCTASLLNF